MAVLNNKDNCSSCLFFTEGGHIGTCKRYPASVIKSPNEWCGEFKLFKREPERKPESVVEIPKLNVIFADPEPVAYSENPDFKPKRGRPFKK